MSDSAGDGHPAPGDAGEPRIYRTLLVDDVASLRLLYRTALERSGRFTVVGEAANGNTAVQATQRTQPDLVLLDVSMPERDGMEALPDILAAAPASRVVVLSGFEAQRLASLALARGATAYLEKGITPTRLVDELLDLLGDARTGAVPAAGPVPATGPAIDEVLALVAHELRDPLAVIAGFADLLVDGDPPTREDAEQYARTIASNARYLDGVVRSLLQLRGLTQAVALVETRPLSPARTIHNIADLLRDQHDIELVVAVDEALPVVHMDPERLRLVLANLVGNAARFAPPGTAVRLEACADGGDLLLRVVDEGPGIAEDDRERVFQRFTRLEHHPGSLGVGLFVARTLVEAMGGRIWIEEADSGTCVCVRLRAADSPFTR